MFAVFLFCFVVGGLGGGFDGPGGGFLFDVVSVVALLPLLLYHLSPDLHPLDYLFWAEVNRRLRRQESRFAKTKRKVLLCVSCPPAPHNLEHPGEGSDAHGDVGEAPMHCCEEGERQTLRGVSSTWFS